jgi:RND family efflux transporter MFP subunit
MSLSLRNHLLRDPARTAGVLAIVVLLTVAVTWLWAHEGAHATLTSEGVAVDVPHGAISLSAEVRAAIGLRTEELTEQALNERIVAPARVMPTWDGRAFATTLLAGKVVRVGVLPGQAVAEGETLAEVESLELENLQLEYRNAYAEFLLAEENLKLLENAAKGAVPRQEVEEARSQVQRQRVAWALARRKLLGLRLEEAVVDRLRDPNTEPLRSLPVRSPLSGVVLHADVRPGQVVEPTQHLFEVVDLARVRVEVEVLATELRRVEVGNTLEVRWAQANDNAVFRGVIEGKSHALDTDAHTGTLWATGSGTPLLPGIRGRAEVLLPGAKKTIVAPSAALVREGAEAALFVQTGPGQYERKAVVAGRQVGDRVEILGGSVYPNDVVVTTGSHQLATFFPATVLRPSAEAARQIGLQVERAGKQTIAGIIPVSGAVELPPAKRAVAASVLSGTVRRIHVTRDQAVQPGDLLAEVASLEFQDLQLELLRNQSELELLQQRLRPLTDSGPAVSTRLARELESIVRTTRLRRDALRNKLRGAGLTETQLSALLDRQEFVDTLPVRAPLGGYVVRFTAAPGQVVKADEPLFEIHDLSGAEVRGYVPEDQLTRVRPGQRARVRLTGRNEQVLDGGVVRVEPAPGPVGSGLSIWVRVDGLPDGTPHGLLADVTVIESESAPVLAAPRDAVVSEGSKHYVFIRKSDDIFERRAVELGRRDDRFIAVTAGLDVGEMVAVRGAAGLQTGYAVLK